MENLEYVLKFALQVIEDNELENTKNSDNWVIGEAIEEQLELVKNCSTPDGDDIWCKASEMSRDNFADWYDNL